MFLRKLGKRGAEMVEYAIVLACIAAVGVGFYSSNDSKLTGVLDSLFGNVRQVLGLSQGDYKLSVKENGKQWEGLLNSFYDEVMSLKPDGIDPTHIKMTYDKDKGTYKLEYYYKNGNSSAKEEKTGVTLTSLSDNGYILSGHNFFYFNEDRTLNKGYGNAPTRIMFQQPSQSKPDVCFAYDESTNQFFNAGGFFSNNEQINN